MTSRRPIRRLFIANRGEIAVRIIRACRALGIECVLGVSDVDRDSLGATLADRTVCIGPAPARASYLAGPTIVTAAVGTSCDAVHPGYGFLSERSEFQRLCADAGLIFVGPSAQAIEAMGNKISAIQLAKSAGLPVVPGLDVIASASELIEAARAIGYPCLIKAAAGGGGRGMRIVRQEDEAANAFASAQREALAAFGDGTLYLEKFIARARHVEIQVLADHHGNIRHLFERDCSVQRRHQKLIEECPAVELPAHVRQDMSKAAVALARAANYSNAGTVEFIYDAAEQRFYFLEMNTRIQVEHPVTELVTGVDIVQQQIRVASGEPIDFDQDAVRCRGHAIECRINAEDPDNGFVPSPGLITAWSMPQARNLRVDTHCFEGYRISPFYDSMIAKVIAHGATRAEAIEVLSGYLSQLRIEGIRTTAGFQQRVLRHPAFIRSEVTTTWVENEFLAKHIA